MIRTRRNASPPREKISRASPRRNCRWTGRRVSTHDKYCLRTYWRNASRCTSSPCRWTRSEREGTHRRREKMSWASTRRNCQWTSSRVSLYSRWTVPSNILKICSMRVMLVKLNTRHRRAPLKRLQVVHRLDKVIVINGLGADYVPPSLPVELIPNRNGDYTRTTTSPRCVEKRLGLQRWLMYR